MNVERFSPLGNLVLAYTGFYWEVQTPIYRARMPVPRKLSAELDGRAACIDWKAGCIFELKTPRIPARLLARAACHFAHELIKHQGQIEALVYLTWSGIAWEMFVPLQKQSEDLVTGAPVRAEDRVGMVVHSHGRLPAFFSPADDASEQDGFLYGVIGGLDFKDYSRISFRFRAGHAGCFLPLKITEIFDV